jgi:1,2-diacylglycerol 3-alpha-glucosyltransferase
MTSDSDKPMRILISSSSYAPTANGQAVFTVNLAEGLAKLGHSVAVVIDSDQGRVYRKRVNDVQIEFVKSIGLNLFHSDGLVSPFPGKDMQRVFDSFMPEIVHIQDHYPSCRAAIKCALERRIKVLGTNHYMPENLAPYAPLINKIKPLFNWIAWKWMLDVYKKLDAATAQSKAAADLLRLQGYKVPVTIISCGIDINRFSPNPGVDRELYCQRFGLDPHKKLFMFIGRIDGEKRIELLLHAMQLVKREDIQLVIAGRGRLEGELHQLSVNLNLGDRVRFTGYIPEEDLPGLLNSIDIFTMPSDAELLSISSLEALACGRPVLLANACALPELVKNDVNGYTFEPGNASELARYMELLADHPDRWGEMGLASRAIAIPHSIDENVHKYERLYETVIRAMTIGEAPKQTVSDITL